MQTLVVRSVQDSTVGYQNLIRVIRKTKTFFLQSFKRRLFRSTKENIYQKTVLFLHQNKEKLYDQMKN